MAQKAILPIDRARITTGYKKKGYTTYMQRTYGLRNVVHYGVDMTDVHRSQKNLRAPFDMKIVKRGYDTLLGNTIIATSVEKIDIHDGKHKGEKFLAIRLCHLKAIGSAVKEGEVIKQGAYIGQYGSTGRYGGADHLHVELDLDPRFPIYSPTITANSNIWRKGTDSTVAPMNVFKVAEKQSFYATYWADGMDEEDTVTLTTAGKVIKAKKKV